MNDIYVVWFETDSDCETTSGVLDNKYYTNEADAIKAMLEKYQNMLDHWCVSSDCKSHMKSELYPGINSASIWFDDDPAFYNLAVQKLEHSVYK